MPLQRAEAGIRPGGRPPFLCATRKEAPIRAPQSATPSRCEGANLRRGACGVRRGTHCALRAPFGQPRRVSARSGCVLRHTRHPASTPTQAQPEGVGTSRAIAALGPGFAGASATRWQARPSAAMARVGCWTPTPFVCACGAQGMADQGSRLSERRRREFERDPASTEHHRLPGAKRRDADSRVAFFCLLFLARQEKKVPRRGHIPAPALKTRISGNYQKYSYSRLFHKR